MRELARLSNQVPGRIDRVHGLYPCSDVFVAVRDAECPYFELEFARLYYNKLVRREKHRSENNNNNNNNNTEDKKRSSEEEGEKEGNKRIKIE